MPAHQPDILTDKKERSDFFIALFVILIAGIFITQTSLLNLFSSDPQLETPKKMASTAIVDTEDISTDVSALPELTLSKESEIKAVSDTHTNSHQTSLSENITHHSSSIIQTDNEINYAEEIPVIAAIKETSTEITSEVKDKLSEKAGAIKEKLTDVKTVVQEEVKEVIDTVAVTSKNISSNIQETEIDIEQERQNVLTSAIQESTTEASGKKDCIIAIGLFRDQKNIKVLSNRLEIEGYDVFSKNIKSMTQVGVYISCDPVISKSVLSEIREIYAKDAFIVEQ